MTSQINTANINTAYPVAGVDNDSQGFRDNFLNIKAAVDVAASEITNLQLASTRNISVKDYGALGDGDTDDTSSLQLAITTAEDAGVALYIPAGTYKTTATLTITKRLHLYGDGAKISIISSSALEAIVVATPVGYGNTFSYFHDFGIDPSVLGGGTSGFVCRLSMAGASYSYMSNFVIDRLYIGDFGGYGMVFDNSVANGNGFFTFTVRRCWISNGLNLNKIGDSCNIEENTITDGATVRTNHSGGRVGVLYTGLSGARQVVLRSNNITTSGGAIAAISAEQLRIENNQCEHPFYYYVPYGASGPYNSHIYLYNCAYTEIRGNTIQPGSFGTISCVANTNSTTSVLSVSSMANIYTGCTVAGSGIPLGTRVSSISTSTFTMSQAATTTLTGTTLTIGYSPDHAVLLEGTSCAYNVMEMNDVFLGTLYHLGLASGAGVPTLTTGIGNTWESATVTGTPDINNADGNLFGMSLPVVTTSTLPPAASIPGAMLYDITTKQVKYSDGASWLGTGGSTGSYLPVRTYDGYGNMASAIPSDANYFRVGDMVSVSGSVVVRTSAYPGVMRWYQTLPIASNILSSPNPTAVFGTYCGSETLLAGSVLGSTLTNQVWFIGDSLSSTTSSATTIYYNYTYKVI